MSPEVRFVLIPRQAVCKCTNRGCWKVVAVCIWDSVETAIVIRTLYLTMAVSGGFQVPYGKRERTSKHPQDILH